MKQNSNHILMVRPSNFAYNEETSVSNSFQKKLSLQKEDLDRKVLQEFDQFVTQLKSKGVKVTVIQDTELPVKPDAVFPNNWISFHSDGKVILYPMQAKSRQLEQRTDIIELLKANYQINELIDYSSFAADEVYLEGTGSIVFDHIHQLAYACLSPRTDASLLNRLCEKLNYKAIPFTSVDKNGGKIYHTNVMMCVGKDFALICLESIVNHEEKELVVASLEATGHEIIDISYQQINLFAGNMLEVMTDTNQSLLILSQQAFNSLNLSQKQQLTQFTELTPIDVTTIETIGGGSVRCMMAEVFLPEK